MRVINKENLIASLQNKDKDELITIIKKLFDMYEQVYSGEEE
tara:strand:- start:5023 stop:5148 length:126 start_codon:yes stop_codon:yes gene_type:complete